MPPHDFQQHFENPVRDAAMHFGAFLQLQNVLKQTQEKDIGLITVEQMQNQFINNYQPKYHTCLVLPELLFTLQKYQIVRKRSKKDSQNKVVRFILHPSPEQVAEPTSIPRSRIYVDQSRVFRDKIHREEIIDENRCRLCNVSFINEDSKQEHIASDEHGFRLLYREKRSSFKSVVGNASIIIDGKDINENEIILRTEEECKITVKVSLDSLYSEATIYKIFPRFDLGDIEVTPTQFNYGTPIEVNVKASFPEPGAYLYPLVAKVISDKHICLLKDLIFRVESELMDQLAPVAPYEHRKGNIIREMEGPILPGEELEKHDFKLEIKVHLPEYKVPSVYNKLLMHKLQRYDNITAFEEENLNKILSLLCGLQSYTDALRQVSRTMSPYIDPLDKDNYSERFSLLVYLEELQEQCQVKSYDRTEEVLKQCNTKFLLQVPDLSEGRPSVNKGDKVHVQFHNKNDVIYEAVIHEIQGEGLLLGLHWEFSDEYKKMKNIGIEPKVDVRFTVNRYPYRNMHRALSIIKKHHAHSIIFPVERRSNFPTIKNPKLRPWVNPLISSNPEQQKAVQKIISRSSGDAPYLVFGPPGTGKTVTLVEAISQVWYASTESVSRTGKISRQLVCAPSNAACNNIAEKLIVRLPATAKIYRLFSMSSDELTIPASLIPYSNFSPREGMTMPKLEEIVDKNHIVIVTIVTAGRIVTGGGEGKFDYVFIDECGQASEPEAIIAVAGILTTAKRASVGQLVLAGDPQQLGPILSSQIAKDFGLGVSLLERLMKHNSLYKKHEGTGYNNDYLTKLVQNYRSHPRILHIPNAEFYDDELQVKGDPKIINKGLNWKELPNKNFPMIFHGVQGLDERESNSPSYFNRAEIDIVTTYLKKLFKSGLPNNYKVQQEDIGIITPYRKQVQKFRKVLEMQNWHEIKVGSVEQFQGDEKLIIFISTVRSSMELVDEDYYFRLGFLKNPKRFNVSVTRAKALLVVVGNPNILQHDKYWYKLMHYCYQNKAYKGRIPFPDGGPPEHLNVHISS